MAAELQYPPGIAGASEALAWQDVREGKAHEAIARLEPIVESRRAAGRPWYSAVYAWAQLEAGNEHRAAEILAGARRLAAASSHTVPPEVLLHSARLAAKQGRWEEAVADLEEGLTHTLGSGLPYEQALLLEAYGLLDADRAESARASDRLRGALMILRELGALPDVERIQQTINALRPREAAALG
jgi:tetratricopeptide (TPR) repeat protein